MSTNKFTLTKNLLSYESCAGLEKILHLGDNMN